MWWPSWMFNQHVVAWQLQIFFTHFSYFSLEESHKVVVILCLATHNNAKVHYFWRFYLVNIIQKNNQNLQVGDDTVKFKPVFFSLLSLFSPPPPWKSIVIHPWSGLDEKQMTTGEVMRRDDVYREPQQNLSVRWRIWGEILAHIGWCCEGRLPPGLMLNPITSDCVTPSVLKWMSRAEPIVVLCQWWRLWRRCLYPSGLLQLVWAAHGTFEVHKHALRCGLSPWL